MKILNLENENRKFTKSIENFHVMEYLQDSSVSPMTAMEVLHEQNECAPPPGCH